METFKFFLSLLGYLYVDIDFTQFYIPEQL